MLEPMNALLLDTNVILDYYIVDRPGHAHAHRVIDEAIMHDYKVLYAAPSIKDVFYLMQMTLKHKERERTGSISERDAAAISASTWACIEHLGEIATAVGADESDVWIARKLRSAHSDLEDNLIIAAAMRAKATYLVTNDEQLIKHAPVAALTPADAIAMLDAQIN